MKILYDYQAFIQRVGGISRYHIELIKQLSVRNEVKLPKLFSENIYLQEINKTTYKLSRWNNPHKNNVYKGINQMFSIGELLKGCYDIFHPTFLNPYYVPFTKRKATVVTIHDLNHEKMVMPDSEIIKEKRKKVLKYADSIITISEETKSDLLKFYNVSEDKITVIYHGAEQNLIECKEKQLIDRPYLLYIGGRKTYKNFASLARAFANVSNDYILVCTGLPFTEEEQLLFYELGISNRVKQIFATEGQMQNLLCNAAAFIYPSLMEGFGLPILEAFRCKCPCLISDIKCFREVAGDSAIYFDPNNVDEMTEIMNSFLNQYAYLDKLKQMGVHRLRLFTWEKTAENTERVYKLLL